MSAINVKFLRILFREKLQGLNLKSSFCTDSRMLTIWRWFEYGAYRQQSKINLVDIGILWIYIDDSAVWVIPHQVHFTPDFALGGAKNLPTKRTFAGFSHLVLSVDSAMIL